MTVDTAPAFPDEFNLADYCLFARLAEGRGAAVALRFGEIAYSYDDVARRTLRLALLLREHGLRQEERVLIVLPDVPAFAWSYFGVLKAGGVVAMGNPDAPAKDLSYLLEYTRAAALITVPRVVAALGDAIAAAPWLRTVLAVTDAPTGGDPDALPGELSVPTKQCAILTEALRTTPAAGVSLPATRRDDLAVWLFTSGSTGHPKAAVHTHRDFAYNIEVYARATVGYRAGDVCVSVPRLFFGYATGTNLMFPFAVGATVGLFSERPTPESLIAAIARYKPTVVTNVPTMIGKLLEHDARLRATGDQGLDLSSIRFCLSAGEALPPALLDRWNARFGVDVYDGIGSAEMFHIYISNRPGDIKPGSLGRVVDGYEAPVLPQDATGPGAEPLPAGEVGTLWVRGDSVALCYWQDRDKSWRTFHGHWCCTGDLFRVDEQGYYWFAGRADELLKVSGLWVAPLEVEECLLRHAAVAEVAVIGVEEAGLTKTKAFVVVRAGAVPDEALARDLQDHVKSRLSKHKYPREVEFVADLPKNDRGKLDRKALRAREQARSRD
jgi:benzoate-CoA ligase family protein